MKGFVDYLLGPDGQAIISGEGTVNLAEGKTLVAKWEEKTKKMGKLWQETDPFSFN